MIINQEGNVSLLVFRTIAVNCSGVTETVLM